MSVRDRIVAEAEAWVGTPYRSRHYPIIRHGCDCASILLGVAIGAGLVPAGTRLPVYSADRHLHRTDEAYRAALVAAGFVEIPRDQAQPGDVLLVVIGERQPASHAVILVACGEAAPRAVHASYSVGRVVRHRLDAGWLDRVRFAFRFPGMDA